jgi:Acetyltransferase (GNAT) domain
MGPFISIGCKLKTFAHLSQLLPLTQALTLSDWMANAGAHLIWYGAQDKLGLLACDRLEAVRGVRDQDVRILKDALAVIVSEGPPPIDQCYITSPKIAWFDYAALELGPQRGFAFLLRALGRLANAIGLSHHCVVGNFPISTVVWTEGELNLIPQVCRTLELSRPDRFLFVRNIRPDLHAELCKELVGLEFYTLPARVVYEFDLRKEPEKIPSQLKRDMKYASKLSLQCRVVEKITREESEQLHALYYSIYIEKHGPFNAQYTAQFLSDMINEGLMRCLMLHDSAGVCVAFALLHQVDVTLTVPALGYDVHHQEDGLYRALFVQIFNHALTHQLLLNYSSGAGEFKRKRGGVPRMEFTMVKAPQSYWQWKSKFLKLLQRWSSKLGVEELIALGA